MRPRSRPVLLVLLLAPGCHAPQVDETSLPPPTTAPPPEHASTTGEATSEDAASAAISTDDPADTGGEAPSPILDVGAALDLGADGPPGCRGKIDFLFVISRYMGMAYFQEELLSGLPDFIATIESRFADFDYHIMVVDGDATWGSTHCDGICPEQCVPNYPCGYIPGYCDKKMGAGTVLPAGFDASNRTCGIDPQLRYIEKSQPDLAATFECLARVGSDGGPYIGGAITAAVQSNINDPGGCNPGFLREDALLMITAISNTFDQPYGQFGSEGTPDTWAQAVLDAKHGDPESVVILNICNADYLPECDKHDGMCLMANMFPYSLVADRESDYGAAFAAASDLVEAACDGFTPPQ